MKERTVATKITMKKAGSGGEEVETTGADGDVGEDMDEGEWRFGLFE
jgi:hypothetical protein